MPGTRSSAPVADRPAALAACADHERRADAQGGAGERDGQVFPEPRRQREHQARRRGQLGSHAANTPAKTGTTQPSRTAVTMSAALTTTAG